MINLSHTSAEDRTRHILQDLEAVRENLLALSNEICSRIRFLAATREMEEGA